MTIDPKYTNKWWVRWTLAKYYFVAFFKLILLAVYLIYKYPAASWGYLKRNGYSVYVVIRDRLRRRIK